MARTMCQTQVLSDFIHFLSDRSDHMETVKVDQCNVVYKIPCTTCSWSYIGETRRSFSTREKEHTRNVKLCTKGSNVANHAWSKNHQIDFENASIIDKSNHRHLKTLESWHTAKTVDADNNSCPLPNQYRILLNK